MLEEQSYQCFYCGSEIDIMNSECDHVNPKNPADEYEKYIFNVKKKRVMTCKGCNNEKGNLPVAVWKILLKRKIISFEYKIKTYKKIIKKIDDL